MMPASPLPRSPEVPSGWVPVERRWHGIDRASIRPALVVALISFVFIVVAPLIDRSVSYDDPIRAGDVLDLAENRLRITPPVGWELVQGSRVDAGRTRSYVGLPTSIAHGGVRVDITTGRAGGSARALADLIDRTSKRLDPVKGLGPVSSSSSLHTESGLHGVARSYTSTERTGLLAVFVIEDRGAAVKSVGVSILVTGSADRMVAYRREIDRLVTSLRVEGDGA